MNRGLELTFFYFSFEEILTIQFRRVQLQCLQSFRARV